MSSRALVTTVVRYADLEQDSGFIYVIDLQNNKLLLQTPMPESIYRAQEDNPRGGLRGARGAVVWQDRLVVANTERLLFFDCNWRVTQEFTHPWLGGIHDILADAEGIWVCCTNADLLVKVSWQGKIIADWEWRQDTSLRETLGLPPIPIVDRSLDYRKPDTMRSGLRNTVHLNGISADPDGHLLLSFGRVLSPVRLNRARAAGWIGALAGRLGIGPRQTTQRKISDQPVSQIEGSSAAIVRLGKDGQAELLIHLGSKKVPNHNILQVGKHLLYNDSNDGQLVALTESNDWSPSKIIKIPGDPPFARGLAHISENHYLVGSQAPTAVYRIDLKTAAILDTIQLSSRPTESVYAISLLPDSFAPPPPSF
jgi:hypothetical protein